jgi:hypothetical protein
MKGDYLKALDSEWLDRCVEAWNFAPRDDLHHWAKSYGYDLMSVARERESLRYRLQSAIGVSDEQKQTISDLRKEIKELNALLRTSSGFGVCDLEEAEADQNAGFCLSLEAVCGSWLTIWLCGGSFPYGCSLSIRRLV